ncbi:hypothetical protein GCM10008910_45440 [Faecalicatena orotica]|uniref:Uncharacterized protein n=1 Tax=Faecalicatena orotica TaxID=1544 RepID=A0A2Y9BEB7_9FIRM|nr:hypothetical protein [Faecalicatena orotica]PWJ29513.1 hypothetical protein A8806_106252 [Faecalicatena orotica]SSA55968.1 hypothetical protein SAMN05216536_106252 [Faecalicatena orotica]
MTITEEMICEMDENNMKAKAVLNMLIRAWEESSTESSEAEIMTTVEAALTFIQANDSILSKR